MIPNYRTVTISAPANTNIVPLIYEQLKQEGYRTSIFNLDFIGFQGEAGSEVYINKNPLKVPSTGDFFTPYNGSSDFIQINSVVFPRAISDMDFWIIY